VHFGPRLGMERGGKRNAVPSGAESWTGIGVVAGFYTVVLIMQWPHERKGEVTWRSELLQRLQEVRTVCKTRNQLVQMRLNHNKRGSRWSHKTADGWCNNKK
jgi:hypothetical protein